MNNFIRAGLGALAISALSGPAAAVSFVNAGDTATIYFNGIVAETVQTGLTAELELTFNGFSGNNALFSYTLTNTSSAPITNSRVSIFGFDVDSAAFSFAGSSETSSIFTKRTGTPGFPQTLGGVRDICFSAGSNCASGAGGGVAYGASESASFTLGFTSLQSLVELSNLIVRYQSIAGTDLGNSGIGIEYTPTGGVPEPATWALLISGFGLVGVSMRRRRGTPVQVSA